MGINKGIEGIEIGTVVDVELCKEGIVEIYTDAPQTCCVAVVKLDEQGLDSLIDALTLARQLIKEVK